MPTNALFNAYYDILPRIGVNADHDSRYARVLFKIGGLRGQGTLYEKFEEILSRMGIEIEFDHEENEELYSQHEDSQTDLDVAAGVETPPRDESFEPRGRARRNSESSAWDLENAVKSQPRLRRSSLSSPAKANADIKVRQGVLQETRWVQPGPVGSYRSSSRHEANLHHDVGAWLSSRQEKLSRERGRSVSTHASIRIRRRPHSVSDRHHRGSNPSIPEPEEYQAASEITAVTSGFGGDNTAEFTVPPGHNPLTEAPGSLMQIKASLVIEHNLKIAAKRLLRKWRDEALILAGLNIDRDLRAANHDRKALLRSAFDSWRLHFIENQNIAKTERFFAHLERRAERARSLYLLHKAFTHWANCAYEQVQRTALARRHIIRTRIFNAWRDITAVNELKVRRQVLRKFFFVWKQNHLMISEGIHAAVQKYEVNLVRKAFLEWIQKIWNAKAAAAWSETRKRWALFRWIVVSHKSRENQHNAEETRRLQLSLTAWRVWKFKTDERVRDYQDAEAFYDVRLCLSSLRKWRGETRVIPAKKVVQTDVASRLLKETFAIWLHRSRQEKLAGEIDRMRVLREGWTNWRLKSRLNMLKHIVDRGVIVKTLYQWAYATRIVEFRRRVKAMLLHETFQIWISKWTYSVEHSWLQENLAEAFAVQKAQIRVIRQWYSEMDTRQRLDMAAGEFHRPRLLQKTMLQWSNQSEHVRQLQKWSRDAHFYFMASKTLRRWKSSTESARREKRKLAYGEVRRMTKLNLARTVLQNWKQKAQHVLDLQFHALDTRQNKIVMVGTQIFDYWRAATEGMAELESMCREHILRKRLRIWRDRSNALQALNTEAIFTWQERRQGRAVKRWSFVALQLRAQSNYAYEIREKNARRTFRKIFSYWHLKAIQRHPRKRVLMQVTDHFGATAKAEAWSDFGDDLDVDDWAKGLDEVAVATPIPGYLGTPSKRTERVMAVAARFSTTPKAPLSTPIERQLRAQWSGGALKSGRRGAGRSTLGMDRGFADIADSSTNKEREARR